MKANISLPTNKGCALYEFQPFVKIAGGENLCINEEKIVL